MGGPHANTAAAPQSVSPEELYNVMCGAASQNPAQVQQSATRLKELLELFGAFDTLHEIAAQRTVPLQVRQQSIIQFKNTALGHWRARKLLSDEQRVRIRARSLTFLDEPDDIIAQCNAVIISKISRQDFPNNWPTLISHIMGVINTTMEARYTGAPTTSALPLRRSLEVLNAVLKEFSSIRMPTGIKTTGQLVEELRLVLQGHYSRIASSFPTTLNPSSLASTRIAEDLLLSHLLFKCLVKMAEWSWNRITHCNDYNNLERWIHELFQNSAMQLRALSELRINLVLAIGPAPPDPVAHRSLDIFTRHVRLFGKLFRRMQVLSPSRFVALPVCSDLVLYYWSKVVQATDSPPEYIADSQTAVFPVRFLVQAMVLFRDSLAQWAPVRKNGTESERVLSKEFVEDAVRLLVTRFIPLNPADLEEWMADPEEWVNTEEKDEEQWQYELRPCGERVLMTLANQYQQYVTPLLVTTFNQIVGQPTVDLSSIIQKEALYCAIGRCAHRLKDVIPFDQWLENTLVVEVRRLILTWLIGKWISNDCSPANNPKIWEVLLHLLSDRGPGSDAVVRFTAAVALRECVDSQSFNVDVFAPFLPLAVTELVRLTAEADTLESKRRVSRSLNTVIELAGAQHLSLNSGTTAGEDWLFKASLLETVTILIKAAKEQSGSLSALVVPLIRDSFSPAAQLHLDEDAFTLWQAALMNANTIEGANGSAGLVDLFPLCVELLAMKADLLGMVVGIVESYFILDASRVLQFNVVNLFQAFVEAINKAMSINIKQITTALAILFQIAPPSLWGEALHVSGLFAVIVKSLQDDKVSTVVLTEYIFVLARIAMADKYLFVQLVSATARSQNMQESSLYESILDQWYTRFDNMSEPRHRKLTAMGIANLVATGRPEVLDRLSTEICTIWLDVFSELKEAANNADAEGFDVPLILYWDRPFSSIHQESEGTPEHDRRRAIFDNDPVRTTQLTTFIAARIQEAEAVCGGGAAFQARYLEKADPLVLKQIYAELVRNRI
ncbi:Importin-11 [Grifola frondosa]|uniref:Importin-11 n=1 Tax=Grifola frondosa TaxID=5627 RepID=A0A1C7MIP2_GRIFR|nr:Importin-11 [Grifola frondosa]